MMWRWIRGVPSSGSSFRPRMIAPCGACGQLFSRAISQPVFWYSSIGMARQDDSSTVIRNPAAMSCRTPSGVTPTRCSLLRCSARIQRCGGMVVPSFAFRCSEAGRACQSPRGVAVWGGNDGSSVGNPVSSEPRLWSKQGSRHQSRRRQVRDRRNQVQAGWPRCCRRTG